MDGSYGNHTVGDLIRGKKIVSYEGKNKYGHHLWNWLCPLCFTEYGPSTISHLKRSDKCRHCNSHERNANWRGYKLLPGILLWRIKDNAKKRNLEWNLDNEYLWELWEKQDGTCFYSGIKLEFKTASLDRTDNKLGYLKGNVRWVHKDINRMKSDFDENYFAVMCYNVYWNYIKTENPAY